MKKYALIAFSLAVLALLVWYTVRHPISPTPDGAATTTPAAYLEEEAYYTIEAYWPQSTPLPGDGNPAAVLRMKNWVQDTILEFKKQGNFANLTPEDIEMLGFSDGRTYTLDVMYFTSSSPKTVSYVYTIATDTGGAHPNSYFKTFTFNTETGTHLALKDVFAPGTSYLTELSRIARAKLPAVTGEFADAEYIASGTEPVEEAFASFFFDTDNLVLLFPPYQVGPYVLGPVTLPIPTIELSESLRAEYVTKN